jgi:hypothetical protein
VNERFESVTDEKMAQVKGEPSLAITRVPRLQETFQGPLYLNVCVEGR